MKVLEEKLMCQKCQNLFDTEVAFEIDNNDGNILDDLVNLKHFLFECPHCKKTSFYAHDLLIKDDIIPTKIFITSNKENAKNFVKECDDEASSVSKNRLIMSNIFDAVEKYMIFKCGLDDRIVEIYKDNIARELIESNIEFDSLSFVASTKDNFNIVRKYKDEHTYYELNIDKYNMLVENFKDFVFMKRNNDYIVNVEFVYNMKMSILDSEPLHYDKLYREHELLAMVEVDGDVLYYNANVISIGKNVLVDVDGTLKEGIYRDVDLVSEAKLGRKFKTLHDIKKVYYTKEEYDNELNISALSTTFDNLDIYQVLTKVSNHDLNKLKIGDILKVSDLFVGVNELTDKEYVTILSSTKDVTFVDDIKYASFKNSYFKVIELKGQLVLLHLPYNCWHLFSNEIDLSDRLNLTLNNVYNSTYKPFNHKPSFYSHLTKKLHFEEVSSLLEIVEEYVLND